MVATCNDIDELPPELLRKGRFDEIFFVDLPDEAERRGDLRLHLERREREPGRASTSTRLAAAAEGFSGAEIEQAIVVRALHRVRGRAGDRHGRPGGRDPSARVRSP